jgi:hypothetical protein
MQLGKIVCSWAKQRVRDAKTREFVQKRKRRKDQKRENERKVKHKCQQFNQQ